MDSLNLYYSFQDKYSHNENISDSSKLNEIDTLINQIRREIFNPSAPFETSSFMNEVIHMVMEIDFSKGKWTSKIFICDAYIVMEGLTAYMKDSKFIAKSYFEGCEKYLFNGFKISDDEIRQVEKIKDMLGQLKELTETGQPEDKPNKMHSFQIDKPQLYLTDNIKTASVSEAEVQSPRKSEERAKQNQINIQLWHDEQAGISAKLLEMQPIASQLLKNFMSFSDNITEKYILQFARMQIELFNLIHDGYAYHKKKATLSGNKNYVNAICNYDEYMLSIIDHLSVFGIEEIISHPKIRFNGIIHEPDIDSFSAKTALIAESIRSGFRYKDIIIQKEKVKIKN